jgi:broad specificity phosphatase PhoE
MRLYFIRHANPEGHDDDSKLTPQGVRQAEMLGRLFLQLSPDRATLQLVTSGVERALETAAALGKALGVAPGDVATFPSLADLSADLTSPQVAAGLMERLRTFRSQGKQTAIVVGHSNHLSDALLWLTGTDEAKFPEEAYAAVASLSCQDSLAQGTGELAWFFAPVE